MPAELTQADWRVLTDMDSAKERFYQLKFFKKRELEGAKDRERKRRRQAARAAAEQEEEKEELQERRPNIDPPPLFHMHPREVGEYFVELMSCTLVFR